MTQMKLSELIAELQSLLPDSGDPVLKVSTAPGALNFTVKNTTAQIYRTKVGTYGKWRYGEGKIRPYAILTANGVYNNMYGFPKGSQKRADRIEQIKFRVERLTGANWIDVTGEFL